MFQKIRSSICPQEMLISSKKSKRNTTSLEGGKPSIEAEKMGRMMKVNVILRMRPSQLVYKN